MSGGSWDYVYAKVDDAADILLDQMDPLRKALGARLKLFARALHDIEWVDSCDKSPGDEVPAILAALGDAMPAAVVTAEVEEAEARVARWRRLALDTTHATCDRRIEELEKALQAAQRQNTSDGSPSIGERLAAALVPVEVKP